MPVTWAADPEPAAIEKNTTHRERAQNRPEQSRRRPEQERGRRGCGRRGRHRDTRYSEPERSGDRESNVVPAGQKNGHRRGNAESRSRVRFSGPVWPSATSSRGEWRPASTHDETERHERQAGDCERDRRRRRSTKRPGDGSDRPEDGGSRGGAEGGAGNSPHECSSSDSDESLMPSPRNSDHPFGEDGSCRDCCDRRHSESNARRPAARELSRPGRHTALRARARQRDTPSSPGTKSPATTRAISLHGPAATCDPTDVRPGSPIASAAPATAATATGPTTRASATPTALRAPTNSRPRTCPARASAIGAAATRTATVVAGNGAAANSAR